MGSTSGFEPEPHWWGASAPLSPLRHPLLPKGTFMKGESQKLFHFVTTI